jgi:hypothetical protein
MSCSSGDVKNFSVGAGATFAPVIRWAASGLTTAPITAITQATPAVITAPNHGVPQGWPVAVVGVTGMPQINARRYPPAFDDMHPTRVVDGNTIALPDVSSAFYQAYVSGGVVVFNPPMPLTGVTPTLTIYDSPERDNVLVTLTLGAGITVDAVQSVIVPELQTAGLPWSTGYYDLDAVDTEGVVSRILTGILTIN